MSKYVRIFAIKQLIYIISLLSILIVFGLFTSFKIWHTSGEYEKYRTNLNAERYKLYQKRDNLNPKEFERWLEIMPKGERF